MAYVKKVYDDNEDLKASQGAAQSAPLTGAGSSGTTSPSGSKDPSYTQSNFVSGKQVLAKNRNAAVPGFTSDYQQKVTDAGAGAQKSYDDYAKGISKYVGGNTITDNAIALGMGNSTQMRDKVTGLLSKPASSGVQSYGGYDPNLNVQDVTGLLTGAGAQDAYMRQQQKAGNYGYTQGQGALDSALFGRDPSARKSVADTLGQRKQVFSRIGDLLKSGEKTASGAKSSLDKNVAESKAKLQAKASEITNAAKQTTASKNKLTDYQKWDRAKDLTPQFTNIMNEVANQKTDSKYASVVKDAQKQLKDQYAKTYGAGKGLTPFTNYGTVSDPYYGDEGARNFNNINAMLSTGQVVSPTAARGANTVDTADFKKALGSQYSGILKKLLDEYQSNEVKKAKDRAIQKGEIIGKSSPYTIPIDAEADGNTPMTPEEVEDLKNRKVWGDPNAEDPNKAILMGLR